MSFTHKVYLDDTLLQNEPNGIADGQFDIIREGGITSDSQILRQKTDIELIFWGDGYAYLCVKKQENYCQDVNVKIYVECETFSALRYEGTIQLINTTTDVKQKTMRTQIKDASWSGVIKDRETNKVFLTATKSATGQTITACPSRIISFFESDGTYSFGSRRVWDVYDVMKWLIKQYSDDTISVVSDYFTTGGAGYHKYAITIGGMLYGGIGWTSQNDLPKYFTPQVSFKEVFDNVRKALRIYMSVDINAVTGQQEIRIEPEPYFFSNNLLTSIPDVPFDFIETYDTEQIYSDVKIGSSETKVEDGTFYTYPKILLNSWEAQEYSNCSECVTDNTLDLSLDWIIDSNVIHFTLDQNNSTAVPDKPANIANGEKIFLIETLVTTEQAAIYTYGTAPNETYYYNQSLQNYAILNNWAGGIPACVANYLYDVCVEGCSADIDIAIPGISLTTSRPIEVTVYDEDCFTYMFTEDFDFEFDDGATNYDILGGHTGSYFVAPADGEYRFTFTSSYQSTANDTATMAIAIATFSSSTVLTSGADVTSSLISITSASQLMTTPEIGFLSVDSGVMSLSAGNIVVFLRRINAVLYTGVLSFNDPCINMPFYDIDESLNIVSYDYLRKPTVWTFSYPLCEDDYQALLADKTGYYAISGKAAWIKEVNYRPQKVSTIKLLTNHTLCC